MTSRSLLVLTLLLFSPLVSFAQTAATDETKSSVPMDQIIFKTGTVFEGQIVEGKKSLIDDPNRYEIVLKNGQTVSIEDVGQIETIKMDGMVLNDPLRQGGRGRLLEMLEEYKSRETAQKSEVEKSRLTARTGWLVGDPEKNVTGQETMEVLKVGALVFPGEEIRTQSNARVQLRVAGSFTIGIEQGTLARIQSIEINEEESLVALEFELVRGTLWVQKEESAEQAGKVRLQTAGLGCEFPSGLKRFKKSPNGDLTISNFEGPALEVIRQRGSETLNLARRSEARLTGLMLEGSRALSPQVAVVGDPIEWFEFTTWKPVEINLPVQFQLTSQDRLQMRPVRPLTGVSSDRFVFQDLQPVHGSGVSPLFAAYREGLTQFLSDTGRFPTPEEGLAVLRSASGEIEGWKGPYLGAEIPDTDPWGNPLEYGLIQIQNRTLVNLYSTGENGIDEQGLGDDLH